MWLFGKICREHEFGIGTIQGVARNFGVHWRLVREALKQAIPAVKTSRPMKPHPSVCRQVDP